MMVSQGYAIRRAGLEWMSAAARQGTAAKMRAVLVATMAAAFTLTLGTATANATTYAVNTLQDTSGNGDCSLRDAINAANGTPTSGSTCITKGRGKDMIQFSVTGTIPLATTLPIVTDRILTINSPASPGITIYGGGFGGVQVMRIASGTTLNLTSVTVSGSSSDTNSGGAILNHGTLTVTNSTFSGNDALATESLSPNGGAIFNDGTLNRTVCAAENQLTCSGTIPESGCI